MQVDPSQIQLNLGQRVYLARLSERTGRPWPELLEEAVPTEATTSVSENDPPEQMSSAAPGTELREAFRALRERFSGVTLYQLLAWRHEGHAR